MQGIGYTLLPVLLFQTLKRVFQFLLSSIVSNAKFTVTWILSLPPMPSQVRCYFILVTSKIFFFVCFQKFNHKDSWCRYLWVYPVYPAQLLESVCLCLLPNLGSFQPKFLQVLYSFCLFLFCDSDNLNVRSFVIIPQVPEALFVFGFFSLSFCCIFFSLFLRFSNFNCSGFQFTGSPDFFILLLILSNELLISVIMFFSSKISI